MKTISIENKTQPLPSQLHAGYCASFLCRLRGLMFRSKLAPQEGLLLVEQRDSRVDASIHMLFVPMDLAVIWINSDLVVVDTVLARSWQPIYIPAKPARYTLEISPQRLGEFRVGDEIGFHDA